MTPKALRAAKSRKPSSMPSRLWQNRRFMESRPPAHKNGRRGHTFCARGIHLKILQSYSPFNRIERLIIDTAIIKSHSITDCMVMYPEPSSLSDPIHYTPRASDPLRGHAANPHQSAPSSTFPYSPQYTDTPPDTSQTENAYFGAAEA